MWINNWNENRKDTNYIEKFCSSIIQELAETNIDIIEKIAIQKAFIDTLDFYLNHNEISVLDITMKSGGIYISVIKINSLKVLSNSQIELMEYEKISALANIEEQKDILKLKAERLGDFAYSNTKETSKEKKEFMKLLMLDIISTEKALEANIESVVNK